jgi:cleavage stimulation factor subunit 3
MDLLRKVYQRAIENPMHNLESIWKEYDQFENSLNKTLAAGLLKEHGAILTFLIDLRFAY